jgi:hypothetical protein
MTKGEHYPESFRGKLSPTNTLTKSGPAANDRSIGRGPRYPPAYPLTHRPTEGGAEHPNGPSQNDFGPLGTMDGEPELRQLNPGCCIRWQG